MENKITPEQKGMSQCGWDLRLTNYFNNNVREGFRPVGNKDVLRISEIISGNNRVAEILESSAYKAVLQREKSLKGDAKLGLIECIDGRNMTIIPFGRSGNIWKEPGALVEVDEKGRLKSPLLKATIAAAAEDRELFEVVMIHSSLETDHKCGKMQADYPHEKNLESINKKIVEKNQIPAITDTYNAARERNGKEKLQQVAITAMYDTDTMGVILGFGSENIISTTEITNRFKNRIAHIVGEQIGDFGCRRQSYTQVNNLLKFSEEAAEITEMLLNMSAFKDLQTEVKTYISANFPLLTEGQSQALEFLLARTVAAQYLTGLAEIPTNGPDHEFAHHKEMYMAISTDGKNLGRHNPEMQVFACSASTEKEAIKHIKTQLSIMDKKDLPERKPYVLFASKAIDKKDLENPASKIRATADSIKLLTALQHDKDIRTRIQNGEIIVVPVFVDQDTGEILEIIDHSLDA